MGGWPTQDSSLSTSQQRAEWTAELKHVGTLRRGQATGTPSAKHEIGGSELCLDGQQLPLTDLNAALLITMALLVQTMRSAS